MYLPLSITGKYGIPLVGWSLAATEIVVITTAICVCLTRSISRFKWFIFVFFVCYYVLITVHSVNMHSIFLGHISVNIVMWSRRANANGYSFLLLLLFSYMYIFVLFVFFVFFHCWTKKKTHRRNEFTQQNFD